MTALDIRNMIISCLNDIMLDYPEHDMIFINPHNDHEFDLSYDDITKTYTSVDELMNDKIFDGKSLEDISDQLIQL